MDVLKGITVGNSGETPLGISFVKTFTGKPIGISLVFFAKYFNTQRLLG
jgi:hypothetical protein